MTRRTRLTTAALAAAASSCHVLYPAWLAWASRRKPAPVPDDPEEWPAVTALVAAYRESAYIGHKVRDLLSNGYPGALDVLVVAEGDQPTAVAAEEAGATVVTADDRLGKAQALNAGFSKVTSPVVVLSDANNELAPGAIAALVRHFSDPRVGAVAGEKVEDDAGGEDLYWRFESWLKQREWRLGTTIGLVGELAAVRTDAWRPIPPDIAIDDMWTALDMAEQGWKVAYEPSAKAHEPPDYTMRQQWDRRTRIVAIALHALARRGRQLGPRGGLVALETWGHRLGRYTVVPLSHLALLLRGMRRARSSRLARLFLLGHVMAAVALLRSSRQSEARAGSAHAGSAHAGSARAGATAGAETPSANDVSGSGVVRLVEVTERLVGGLAQSVFLDAVALGGLARYLRGDRATHWRIVRH